MVETYTKDELAKVVDRLSEEDLRNPVSIREVVTSEMPLSREFFDYVEAKGVVEPYVERGEFAEGITAIGTMTEFETDKRKLNLQASAVLRLGGVKLSLQYWRDGDLMEHGELNEDRELRFPYSDFQHRADWQSGRFLADYMEFLEYFREAKDMSFGN